MVTMTYAAREALIASSYRSQLYPPRLPASVQCFFVGAIWCNMGSLGVKDSLSTAQVTKSYEPKQVQPDHQCKFEAADAYPLLYSAYGHKNQFLTISTQTKGPQMAKHQL